MKVVIALLVLCVGNFAVFAAVSISLGGSAANGRVENGRYFLSEHARETEVSKRVWEYSLWHSRSLFLTHPLALVILLILGSKWNVGRGALPKDFLSKRP